MTGQNNKTQSTKRKNRSEAVQNSSKNKSASKNTRSSSNNKNTSVSTENEELKRKISELESKNNELTKQNKFLQFQVDSYENENSQSLNGDNESQDEVVSDDSSPPAAKRQMRKKSSEDEEKAKSIMKTLLKTFPELELKAEKTFGSKENDDICQKLIPNLQKEMKVHGYNPSYEQVKAWLKSIHRSKRSAFLKSSQSNPMPLDDESDESDSAIQSAKRQTRSKKIRKPNNLSEDDDELKNEESKNDDGSKIEEGAKKLLKRLLDNTYTQDEYKLKFEYTFKNQENADICKKLIPKLQEDIKQTYNLSYKQVEFWLQSIHKTKRKHYMKSNQMDIDEY